MIRKRDFILVVAAGVFLLLVASTMRFGDAHDGVLRSVDGDALVSRESEYDAEVVGRADAELRTQTLREKLSAGEGVAEEGEPILTSVDDALAAEAAAEAELLAELEAETAASRVVTYCSGRRSHSSVATWPAAPRLEVAAGEYRVVYETQEVTTVGTTTQTTTASAQWQRVPVRTVRTGFDSCLPDSTIGVTPAGRPLENTSAPLYVNTSPQTLIGYTRDGFAVYGPLPDESVLDSCGGLSEAGAYRYHAAADGSALIACYAGIPEAWNT